MLRSALGGVQATVSSAPDTTSTPAENGAPGSRDAGSAKSGVELVGAP